MSLEVLRQHNDGFLKSIGHKQPETIGTYQRALREFMRWFSMDSEFSFEIVDVERYKEYLITTRGLSGVSISTYLTAVRRFCQYLTTVGILLINPAFYVNGNKRPVVHSRGTLSELEVVQLFDSIDRGSALGARDYAIVQLMIGCALSEIEIIRANVGDVKSINGKPVLFVQGKGKRAKEDAVLLPGEVKDGIDVYLARRNSIVAQAPLFMSDGNRTRGMRMTTRGVRTRVNEYLEIAGIRKGRLGTVTPYSLRHTAALMMADSGASAEEIRQRMRLGSIGTAMMYIDHRNKLREKQAT